MNDHYYTRRFAGAGLALALFASLIIRSDAGRPEGKGLRGTPGAGAPFSGIFAFGDSLTDTGNKFALTNGQTPGADDYWEGRYSNGIVWIEHLAEQMGLDPDAIGNYAVGGATSGRANTTPGLPGLHDQIDHFEQDLAGKKADKRALYVIWAGANDFLISPDPFVGIANTEAAVQRLYDMGARRIMVINLPDLGLTPYGKSGGPAAAGYLSFVTALYNDGLAVKLDEMAGDGVETIRVNSAGIIQAMASNPGDFGFIDVCLPFLGAGEFLGDDPAEYLFWDFLHPTTAGHFYVAEEAMRVLSEQYRHVLVVP